MKYVCDIIKPIYITVKKKSTMYMPLLPMDHNPRSVNEAPGLLALAFSNKVIQICVSMKLTNMAMAPQSQPAFLKFFGI